MIRLLAWCGTNQSISSAVVPVAFTLLTAGNYGSAVEQVCDVGVAGLHRLLAVRPTLDRADCLIVVAGMDGALPSVVGGLVGTPLVASAGSS